MDVSKPAPRVNFEMLQHFLNKRVKLVGEVTPWQLLRRPLRACAA